RFSSGTFASLPKPTNDSVAEGGIYAELSHHYVNGINLFGKLTGDLEVMDALRNDATRLYENINNPYARPNAVSFIGRVSLAKIMQGLNGGVADKKMRAAIQEQIDQFLKPEIPSPEYATISAGWTYDINGHLVRCKTAQIPGYDGPCDERGFIRGSHLNIGIALVEQYLGDDHPDVGLVRRRLYEHVIHTVKDLYPYNPDPTQRRWVYDYQNFNDHSIAQTYMSIAGDTHPLIYPAVRVLELVSENKIPGTVNNADVGTIFQRLVEQLEATSKIGVSICPSKKLLCVFDDRPDVQDALARLNALLSK
ncbi:MAG: hypothetical protein KDD53_12040, partial [Bdellovibrionales bacterium]|nr:hypothetical protein [Bdellovibrionales bacterium]